MPIRNNTNPQYFDLSGGLSDVLRRNGMQAHLSMDAAGPELIVLGHDSPGMTYKITNQQAEALMDWGTNSSQQKAYDTLVHLVKDDFEIPKDFVHARNAGSRVAMGLNGYRLGAGEYGIPSRPWRQRERGWGGDFLGWCPRMESGYHLRRIGGQLFFPNQIVPERPDRAMKPGELTSGGYGFYYKGRKTETKPDVLKNFQPVISANRPKGQAIRFQDEIASSYYFTNEKLQEVLSSHGLIINKDNKTLTVQAQNVDKDFRYSLTDRELSILTANKLNPKKGGHHLKERFEIISGIIKRDFDVPQDNKRGAQLIFDNIKTRDMIDLKLRPEVANELSMKQQENLHMDKQAAKGMDIIDMSDARQIYRTGFLDKKNTIGVVDGRALDTDKGWYLPSDNGRAVSVGEIRAYATKDNYLMTAVVNGQILSHPISQEDYNHFLNYNDRYRLKLFDQIFDEVKIKSATNGLIEDPFTSGKLEETKGVVSLHSGYSLVSKTGSIPIDSAMAWKDHISEDYSINIRLQGDPGVRTFRISEQQYRAYAQATDDERAAMLTRIAPLSDSQGHPVSVIKTIHLPVSDIEKNLSVPGLSNERAAAVLNELHHTDKSFNYEPIENSHLHEMASDEVKMIAQGKALPNQHQSREDTVIGIHGDAGVNGASITNLDKGHEWHRGGEHGRESQVGDIAVAKMRDAEGHVIEGKYRMSAVIDGNTVSHEINQKTYDKFLQVDNLHRMKLFDKIFDEVKIQGDGSSHLHVGAAILAALTTGLHIAADIALTQPRPEIYSEGFAKAPVYFKPGVVSPVEVAAGRFENEDQSLGVETHEVSQGRSI